MADTEENVTGDAQDWPVTWREFSAIIHGLKVRAQGESYEGPQAHWVNLVWNEVIAPKGRVVLNAPTLKGTAREKLGALSSFVEEEVL